MFGAAQCQSFSLLAQAELIAGCWVQLRSRVHCRCQPLSSRKAVSLHGIQLVVGGLALDSCVEGKDEERERETVSSRSTSVVSTIFDSHTHAFARARSHMHARTHARARGRVGGSTTPKR